MPASMQRDGGRPQRGRGRGRAPGRRPSRGSSRGESQQQGWMSLEEAQRRSRAAVADRRIAAATIRKFDELADGEFVPRPDDGGTAGRPIRLKTNCYELEWSAAFVYTYESEIARREEDAGDKEKRSKNPEQLPARLKRAIISECSRRYGWKSPEAYDGQRTIYSSEKLFEEDATDCTVEMQFGGREQKFDVKISSGKVLNIADIEQYVTQRSLENAPGVSSALDTCIRSIFHKDPNCLSLARAIFFRDQTVKTPLPGDAELWQGHSQSVRSAEKGLLLNMDLAHAAFRKEEPVLDLLLTLSGARTVENLRNVRKKDWARIRPDFAGLIVDTTHLGEKNARHRTAKLTTKTAESIRFRVNGGGEKTVASYWQEKYGGLKYPWLPCLDVSRGKGATYLPLEVCRVVRSVAGDQRLARLSGEQTRDTIKIAAKNPRERLEGIRMARNKADFNNNPDLKAFKISVDEAEVEVDGRILPQPYLEYQLPKGIDTGKRGAWNLRDVQLLVGSSFKSWAVVSFAPTNKELVSGRFGLEQFLRNLVSKMKQMGLSPPDRLPPFVDGTHLNAKTALSKCVNEAEAEFEAPPDLVMVLLPKKAEEPYKTIKANAMLMGIMTQCVVTTNAGLGRPPKRQDQYLANLILKINVKLGGKNAKLAEPLEELFPQLGLGKSRPFIVFGADVTHPTTNDKSVPSVGAVVGSMGTDLARYSARLVNRPHRQETIDMQQAIRELLERFRSENGVLPAAVVFYRDGVSDAQFDAVLKHEHSEIRKAFEDIDPSYSPPITYLVVKKGHSMRLFPSSNDGDRNGNALPGTVVDRGITSGTEYDWYLNSQAGIQGTNKPAHYYPLLDENGFGSDGIQILTNWICYLFARCTRSVSYATPAYYAHLAALHGSYLLRGRTDKSAAEKGKKLKQPEIHEALKEASFFI